MKYLMIMTLTNFTGRGQWSQTQRCFHQNYYFSFNNPFQSWFGRETILKSSKVLRRKSYEMLKTDKHETKHPKENTVETGHNKSVKSNVTKPLQNVTFPRLECMGSRRYRAIPFKFKKRPKMLKNPKPAQCKLPQLLA